MKAVITATGRDSEGIIAAVSTYCAEHHVNIDHVSVPFAAFADGLAALGKARGLDIRAMHEDIFNTMHHI